MSTPGPGQLTLQKVGVQRMTPAQQLSEQPPTLQVMALATQHLWVGHRPVRP